MMATVLVVDDDDSVLETLEAALEAHEVVTAGDGQEALDTLGRQHVDAVVLDIMMPRLDGIETLRRMRLDSSLRDVPVVVLTGKVGEDDHLRGFQAGADAYVTKPFDPETLVEALEQVLHLSPDERQRRREEEKERAALLRQLERRFR
jgi:CheY-like chemotaxis protein